jgi:hypothetical protein
MPKGYKLSEVTKAKLSANMKHIWRCRPERFTRTDRGAERGLEYFFWLGSGAQDAQTAI